MSAVSVECVSVVVCGGGSMCEYGVVSVECMSVECVSMECGVCRVCAEMWKGRHITREANPIHMC